MPLESDGQTSTLNSQNDAAAEIDRTSDAAQPSGVNRRGLIKAVGGGILGALAVQEVLAPSALAAPAPSQPAGEPARTNAPAATAACSAAPSAGPCSEPIRLSGRRVTSA